MIYENWKINWKLKFHSWNLQWNRSKSNLKLSTWWQRTITCFMTRLGLRLGWNSVLWNLLESRNWKKLGVTAVRFTKKIYNSIKCFFQVWNINQNFKIDSRLSDRSSDDGHCRYCKQKSWKTIRVEYQMQFVFAATFCWWNYQRNKRMHLKQY